MKNRTIQPFVHSTPDWKCWERIKTYRNSHISHCVNKKVTEYRMNGNNRKFQPKLYQKCAKRWFCPNWIFCRCKTLDILISVLYNWIMYHNGVLYLFFWFFRDFKVPLRWDRISLREIFKQKFTKRSSYPGSCRTKW